MTDIPKFSPGCFGSALAFKRDDVACRSCKFAELCEPAHLEAQRVLRERYGIQTTQEVIREKNERAAEEKAARRQALDPAALTLPKKVQDLILRIDRGNYDIVGKLQRGENPFGKAIPYMAVICHLLLRVREPFGRDYVAAAFARKFEWAPGTADAHARMAIKVLEHVGAIDHTDGQIRIREAA